MRRTFTVNDGLAHNFVQSICQDKTGFIWIATWDGLSRFDGVEFKNYYSNPKDSASLPFFCLDKVVTDRFGNLFVYCLNRTLSIYNPALDRFEPFRMNGKMPIRYFGIDIDNKGNTWLSSDNAIYVSKGATNVFDTIKVVNEDFQLVDAQSTFRFIAIDNKGKIWSYFNSEEGLTISRGILVNDKLVKLVKIKPLNQKKYKSFGLHNSDQVSIYQSESNHTWMFSKYGLFLFDPERNEFMPFTSKIDLDEFKGQPYFIWQDDHTGINVIDTEKKSHFTFKPNPGQYFETVFIDQQQTVWTGTISSSKDEIGLNRYIKIPNHFKHYLTEKNDKKESNHITPILKDRFGDIWAGAKGLDYLYKIKPDGKINKINYLNQTSKKNPVEVKSMVEDSLGIWIGCTDNSLKYYEFRKLKFSQQITVPENVLKIHNILKTKDKIIVNCDEGIQTFDIRKKELKFEFRVYERFPSFTIVNDGKEGYWIGSFGAYLFHLDSQFKIDLMFRFQKRDEIVQHILPGDNDDVWIALQGGGLGHQFLKSGISELFATDNGLSNNTLYSILKDRKGRLWLSHEKGISCFNPETCQFRNFGSEDGIKIEEFSGDSYFLAPDEEMFFGGKNGIVSFYPEEIIKINEAVSPLVITSLSVSGNPRYFDKPINELTSVNLKKGENNFNVSFASLNFKDDLKIRYRNRLIGVSDEWKLTDGKNRNIGYFNLRPGTYLLEIEASDKNGNWDSKTSLTIIIPFKIYQTIWFNILLVMTFLGLIILLIILYIRQLKFKARQEQDELRLISQQEQNELKLIAQQEQEELRLEALRNQMNPHFIFNSLNSINYFISKNDKLSANSYIADFSRLIRSFLTNLSNDFIPLETELQLLKDYLNLESLRFGDKFTYSLNINNLMDIIDVHVFPGIVQPFIENAIWHGISGLVNRKGYIKIQFNVVSQTMVQCVIEDDGIGRGFSAANRNVHSHRKSRGMAIINERLKLYNNQKKTDYKVTIEDLYSDRFETGTRVIVELPVRY
ncbi:MAG: histidine kinase [Mariniphaga sp.]